MLRFAIVEGSGFIDEYTYAVSRSREFQITAVVEGHPAAAEPLISLAGLNWSVTTWQRLLSNHADDFDVLVLHEHVAEELDEIISAADEAGKHVLISISPVRCQASLRRVNEQSTNILAAVAQPRRFMHYQRSAWQTLQTRNIGKLGLMRLHRWMSKAVLRNGEEAVAEMIAGEVDLASWYFNAIPEVVFATTVSRENPIEGILCHLGFPDGGMALIDCHHNLSGNEDYESLTLIGANGAFYADDQHNTNLLLADRTYGLRVPMVSDWFRHQLLFFVEAVRENRLSDCTISDALRSVDIAEAAIDSFRVGQAITKIGRGTIK